MANIRTVLLVDDDEDIRAIGKMALEEVGGFSVSVADSGTDAITIARAERPDVVMLDVMMPKMDGPTTFRALQEHPQTAAIPIVFVTAKVQRHEIQRYLGLGAIGVIHKPFDPMTLSDELQAIVARASRGE